MKDTCGKHEGSTQHDIATKRLGSFKACHIPDSHGTVAGTVVNQLHGDAPAFVHRNRQHVKTVLDIALLCARMEIPLRGHRETEESLNKGRLSLMFTNDLLIMITRMVFF